MIRLLTSAALLLVPAVAFGQVVINEVDADQTGTDSEEFIELRSAAPRQSLTGLAVVLYNGSDDASYDALDLDGFETDENGLFVIGSATVPNVDLTLAVATNAIQNGADAVALYQADAADFPNDTPVTSAGLLMPSCTARTMGTTRVC